MRAQLLVLLTLLLLAGGASAESVVGYQGWDFSYDASWANVTYGEMTEIRVYDGVAYLSGILRNISEDSLITLHIYANVSPYVVSSGIRLLLNDTVVEEMELESGEHLVQFHSTESYKEVEMTILVYAYGGNISVGISPITIEEPRGGVDEGLTLSAVGISVVFAVLGILAGVMYLLKPRGNEVEERKKEKNMEVESMEAKVNEVSPETVAAIAGALSLYLGGKKFRIISVEPSPWKVYGRLKNMRR